MDISRMRNESLSADDVSGMRLPPWALKTVLPPATTIPPCQTAFKSTPLYLLRAATPIEDVSVPDTSLEHYNPASRHDLSYVTDMLNMTVTIDGFTLFKTG